jgi:hypothetical protein
MNLYHANDFVVSLPEGLKDKSIHIFSLADEGPSEAGIVVARDRLRGGEDLDAFLDRQLTLVLQRMPLFQLQRREPFVLDRQPARLTECIWFPPEGKTFQRQVAVCSKTAPRDVLLLSVSCKEALTAKGEALFAEFLANFRLRT